MKMRNRNDIRQAQRKFFKQAQSHRELSKSNFAKWTGCSVYMVTELFSDEQWTNMREAWLRKRLHRAMHKVYRNCVVQKQFTVKKIIKLMKGVDYRWFNRILADEWRALRSQLPTDQEKVLATLEEKVRANTPVNELTRDQVIKDSGISTEHGEWLSKPLRAAQRKLASQQKDNEVREPPAGEVIAVKGGWIHPGHSQWDLRFAKGKILRKEVLRADLAEIGWTLLEEELRQGEIGIPTLCGHHYGLVLAGKLLGSEVTNIHAASLEGVQRAWHKYEGSETQRAQARHAMVRLFSHLISAAPNTPAVDGAEMLRIASWLSVFATVRYEKPDLDFLSAAEMDAVIGGCIRDIQEASAFIIANPDWKTFSTVSHHKENASAVVRWGVALMILIMAVTGLRRQSIAEIELGDWAEIYPGIYALAWHHGKGPHEDVAAVSALIIDLLQQYVDCTAAVRQELGTERVFLTGDTKGNWYVYKHITSVSSRLHEFTKRHCIKRGDEAIKLNPIMMRRTYATRELYEGRSLQVLQHQLGHIRSETTERYVQFDRFEHPDHVSDSLDRYGRAALTPWRNPVLLDDICPDKRKEILADRGSRDLEVGLCSQARCVKADEGGLPPCSLCEHLVTGPEFFGAWESEHDSRIRQVERLASIPEQGHLVAEKLYQLRRFESNFEYVKGRTNNSTRDERQEF